LCFSLQLQTTFINSLYKPWTQMLSWNSASPRRHPPLHLLLLLLLLLPHPWLLGREEALTAALWTATAACESRSAPPTDCTSTERSWKPCASRVSFLRATSSPHGNGFLADIAVHVLPCYLYFPGVSYDLVDWENVQLYKLLSYC